MDGEPDYLHRKEEVTISPVHVASLAAASPPHPGRLTTLRSIILDMEGRPNTFQAVAGGMIRISIRSSTRLSFAVWVFERGFSLQAREGTICANYR